MNNYFDLTDQNNNILNLSITVRDNFNCDIVDNHNTIYNGFKLAQSEQGQSFTICDLNFQKSETDNKYQARLTFRKTDKNLKDKKLRADCDNIRIPFEEGQQGYREFWKMIAFLYKWKETIDLEDFDNYFTITEKKLADTLLQLGDIDNKDNALNNLSRLPKEKLENINNLVNTVQIKNILDLWKENKDNDAEEFWQETFQSNTWILSQIFACPFILLREKVFCGGKEDDNKGGVEGDFLYTNALTKNLAFVEIKTPKSTIIGKKYRGGNEGKENTIFSMHEEITGGVNQVLNQKKTYLKNYGEPQEKLFNNAKCILIIGTLPETNDQKKSFELYRSSLKDVEIITFDELFTRIQSILDILQ